MAIKTDKTKFYTVTSVCVTDRDTEVDTWKPLYLTLGEAAQAVADTVNETLMMDNREANVKAEACAKGYTLCTGGGMLNLTITAHDRPYGLLYMDCDNIQQSLDLFPDKKTAEQAVAKKVKQGFKDLGHDKPDVIYADRNGECEIEESDVKKEESYITIDTIGGNHITWQAKQI